LIQNITWSEVYNKSTLSIWNLASSRHELKEHTIFSESKRKKKRKKQRNSVEQFILSSEDHFGTCYLIVDLSAFCFTPSRMKVVAAE